MQPAGGRQRIRGSVRGQLVVANGSDQWLATHGQPSPTMPPRVHLHRVVPSVPSRWIGHPLHTREMLPGQRGRMPTRIARRSGTRGRLTRAMTDSHRAALLTRHASSASTPLQPLAAPQSRLAIRPSPPNPGPSPSLSQSRGELRSPDCGREGVGFARGGRERAEPVFLRFPIAPPAFVITRSV